MDGQVDAACNAMQAAKPGNVPNKVRGLFMCFWPRSSSLSLASFHVFDELVGGE